MTADEALYEAAKAAEMAALHARNARSWLREKPESALERIEWAREALEEARARLEDAARAMGGEV